MILWQLAITLMAALYAYWAQASLLSALAGGLCAILPNLWLALKLRQPLPVDSPSLRLQWITLRRVLLTMALFVIVFVGLPDLDPIIFFSTFILSQAAFIIVLLLR